MGMSSAEVYSVSSHVTAGELGDPSALIAKIAMRDLARGEGAKGTSCATRLGDWRIGGGPLRYLDLE